MDEKFIKAVNKITSELDRLLKADFIGRDDFSALLTNADALVAHGVYGKYIKDDLDYLWKSFDHEVDMYTRKGGDVSGFNAEFLVNKLRDYWINFTKRVSEDEGGDTMKEKESRMSTLMSMNEEKRYTAQVALDHVRDLNSTAKGMAGAVSRVKVITIDYDNSSKAATIERLYKQLVDELYSVEEVLTLEVEKDEKKVKKAEKDLEDIEEPTPEEELPAEEVLGGEEDELGGTQF